MMNEDPEARYRFVVGDLGLVCARAGSSPDSWEGTADDQIVARGIGPNICIKQNYQDFKDSYLYATGQLVAQIRPWLFSAHRRIEMEIHRSEGYGDYIWHTWRVFERRGVPGDVTAEDAARVLRV